MAAGTVISVLSNIPWGQVVDAAPKIAEGAGRLWEAAKNYRKSPAPATANAPGAPTDSSPEAVLAARVAELETTLQALRGQMQASAEVIKELADQNTQLVRRVEQMRHRQTRLTFGCAIALLALTTATAWLWLIR